MNGNGHFPPLPNSNSGPYQPRAAPPSAPLNPMMRQVNGAEGGRAPPPYSIHVGALPTPPNSPITLHPQPNNNQAVFHQQPRHVYPIGFPVNLPPRSLQSVVLTQSQTHFLLHPNMGAPLHSMSPMVESNPTHQQAGLPPQNYNNGGAQLPIRFPPTYNYSTSGSNGMLQGNQNGVCGPPPVRFEVRAGRPFGHMTNHTFINGTNSGGAEVWTGHPMETSPSSHHQRLEPTNVNMASSKPTTSRKRCPRFSQQRVANGGDAAHGRMNRPANGNSRVYTLSEDLERQPRPARVTQRRSSNAVPPEENQAAGLQYPPNMTPRPGTSDSASQMVPTFFVNQWRHPMYVNEPPPPLNGRMVNIPSSVASLPYENPQANGAWGQHRHAENQCGRPTPTPHIRDPTPNWQHGFPMPMMTNGYYQGMPGLANTELGNIYPTTPIPGAPMGEWNGAPRGLNNNGLELEQRIDQLSIEEDHEVERAIEGAEGQDDYAANDGDPNQTFTQL